MLISRTSRSQTVDAINAAHFEGHALTATERTQVAQWIAARQGLSGSYGGTFAGFPPNARGASCDHSATAPGLTEISQVAHKTKPLRDNRGQHLGEASKNNNALHS
jgi:hypothetical protein